MLKALVRHDLWRSAITLWGWNPGDALGESLVGELMSKNLWVQSLRVISHLLASDDSTTNAAKLGPLIDVKEFQGVDGDVMSTLNDALRLTSDPTFIPKEEQRASSGLVQVVNARYTQKSQWQEAIDLLLKLSERSFSLHTKREILSVAAAKSAYHGERFEDTIDWIQQSEYFQQSASFQRVALRSAVVLHRFEDVVSILETLSKQGLDEVPTLTLEDFCKQFIREYEEGKYAELLHRFAAVVSRCASRLYCKKTRDNIRQFLIRNAMSTDALDVTSLLERTRDYGPGFCEALLFPLSKGKVETVTDIDQAASALLSRGNWKASLELLKKLVTTEAVNEREKVILESARSSLGSWKTALLFFT
ncbi:hypothetical protein DQ04_00121190 [Trypanosoma grayi]|uniref:hypothetical protein n=1 Tax=Trypanosoma grayi TaxID=71804 RepID=UPI0004F447E2|nr:hypothetical protein DQ04_00121190 [Trypanosoma grayi]KEG15287.1 hypothetical protein DQ04_00121190 [Trypanosoma grayi]